MQIIDTFSGIGGFSLAGSWMGWRTIQFCEIDKFCQKVLKYHWPDVPLHEDIKTLTSGIIKSSPLYEESESTIFVGGIPCQPWSLAGKRKGEDDDRNLWPQSISLIKSFRPDWAVLENVSGFVNWSSGVVFEQVQADLEAEGYEVQAYVLPAVSVNAPHRRDRVWVIAHCKSSGTSVICDSKEIRRQIQAGCNANRCNDNGSAPDTAEFRCGKGCGEHNDIGERQVCQGECNDRDEIRRELEDGREHGSAPDTERQRHTSEEHRAAKPGQPTKTDTGRWWSDFPTQPPLRSRDDGIPGGLDGITVSRLRNESIKAYGNAIVPQVFLQIALAINEYESTPGQ